MKHFLCFPLVNASSRLSLEQSIEHFRNEPGSSTIPAEAIRPVGTIHLTIGIIRDGSYERVTNALHALQQLDLNAIMAPTPSDVDQKGTPRTNLSHIEDSRSACSQSSESSSDVAITTQARSHAPAIASGATDNGPAFPPLTVTLRSLQAMHAEHATSILYAVPEDSTGRLYRIGSEVRRIMTEAGFLAPDSRPLKLHATIVNTIYVNGRDWIASLLAGEQQQQQHTSPSPAKDTTEPDRLAELTVKGTETKKLKRPSPPKLDARALVDAYKDHVWARDVVIDRIAICEMGAQQVKNDAGEVVDQVYEEVGSVSIR